MLVDSESIKALEAVPAQALTLATRGLSSQLLKAKFDWANTPTYEEAIGADHGVDVIGPAVSKVYVVSEI